MKRLNYLIGLLVLGGCVDPNPPPPPPEPVAYLFLIHESGDATPETADVVNSKDWKDAADAKKIRWIVVDDDNAETLLPEIVKAARTQGLPAIVWTDDAQNVIEAEPMPTTPELMLKLVRDRKGAK